MLAIPQEGLQTTHQTSSWLGEAPEDEDGEEQRVLLRFGSHRDPVLVARLVQYNLIEPENAHWKAGHRAAVAYREREGSLSVPYNHEESGFPLGRWLSDQRRAMRGGGLPAKRAADLDALGIVWEPADEAWEENLGAAAAYFETYGTLAAPVTAAMIDRPIGQFLANARKKNGLGKDRRRAERRAALLAAIDLDWNPDWPIDWQRAYATLAQLAAPGSMLAYVEPGTVVHGIDLGRWLATQRRDWHLLQDGQRERLATLGIGPAEKPEVPAQARRAAGRASGRASGGASGGAFERGVAALAQYKAREGKAVVARGHVEELPDGTSVRLGVWLSNTRSRRAGLSEEQREQLAGLGLDWAAG
ncbi:helicase associated domain-containing protein [Streptomyces sp. NPDC055287]